MLARVIGAGRRRIVAVIGGDDQQIRFPQHRQHVTKALVEALEVVGVPLDVVAVPVRVSKSTRLMKTSPDPSARMTSINRSTPSPSLFVEIAFSYASAGEQIPTLPIETRGPCLVGRSSSVSRGGVSA